MFIYWIFTPMQMCSFQRSRIPHLLISQSVHPHPGGVIHSLRSLRHVLKDFTAGFALASGRPNKDAAFFVNSLTFEVKYNRFYYKKYHILQHVHGLYKTI